MDALPGGGGLTREPGGRWDLSSAPARPLGACVETTAADPAVPRTAVGQAGPVLVGRGLASFRAPPRVLDHPRYRAVEGFVDREGPWGPRHDAPHRLRTDRLRRAPAERGRSLAHDRPDALRRNRFRS
ncbi:gamma-glutamylcysteine synthetase [Streptomyces sp. B3I7]|uniref:hypothetical protein n=1 Tax=Streptomyces sp. B3I7 TaxID=3042269 RepID=UPI00278B3011|nr:hypothetical protein [Streptomyces sp. B3I7]MDQ0814294.1 gamma-glutamylcysteine synthetase [Streptomyces sp. B3I7]